MQRGSVCPCFLAAEMNSFAESGGQLECFWKGSIVGWGQPLGSGRAHKAAMLQLMKKRDVSRTGLESDLWVRVIPSSQVEGCCQGEAGRPLPQPRREAMRA